MDILVDTHILIWVLDIETNLSRERLALLEDFSNKIFLSQISLMELAIKKKIGKLPAFIPDLELVMRRWLNDGYEILPFTNDHIFAYQQVPFFEQHRDPFDRFIIGTAMHENMLLMSDDKNFHLYAPRLQII